jgi:hypothetical protein
VTTWEEQNTKIYELLRATFALFFLILPNICRVICRKKHAKSMTSMFAVVFITVLSLLVSAVAYIPHTGLPVIRTIPVSHVDSYSTSHINKGGRQRQMYLEGGKMSKFGIFSPAVYAAKFVLGEAKLNKLRGKAIALHSQAITEWCVQFGAYNLRLKLIKKAKKNGDVLGFLV